MTDTIDVAALVETVLGRIGSTYDNEAHLSGDEARALATALQSQADALAEARRNSDIAFRAAIDSGEALENAQEELATMREALEANEKLLLIRSVRAAAEAAAPLWLEHADSSAIKARALGGSNAE